MSNPNNFDEASAATEEMFANNRQDPDNAQQDGNPYPTADGQNTDDPSDYEPYGTQTAKRTAQHCRGNPQSIRSSLNKQYRQRKRLHRLRHKEIINYGRQWQRLKL